MVPTDQHLCPLPSAEEFTERPHAPSGVAAFTSAHSKTPCIASSMEFSSRKGVVRGRRGQQLGFTLLWLCVWRRWQAGPVHDTDFRAHRKNAIRKLETVSQSLHQVRVYLPR